MPNNSEILIYQNPAGEISLDVRLEGETVWLTQAHLCELFQKSKPTISEHIKHVFEEGELDEKVVVRKFRTTTQHGAIKGKTQSKDVNFYNLDVIISVGYRVRSMNYFSELQERIREIRISERFFFTRRSRRSIRLASTTTRRMKKRFCFSKLFRINCYGRLVSGRRRSWSIVGRMQRFR